jgi:DNA end-binding protein Ku
MARSMWRGAIQFGLVTIPVKLYLATEARGGLSFNLLHKSCLTKIQMQTYCPFHDEVIPRSETVRGFEWSKGEYVVIEEGDLESVPLKTVRAIEIEMFVDAQRDSHGANFVKQAYYLEPEAIGRKAFYLLKSVLGDSGLQAICKIVLKDREALAALSPYSNTMMLTTLYWPDEVRSIEELKLPEEEFEFKPAERKMAEQLVAAMKGDFSADEYKDDYRQALMAVIEAKIAGKETTRPAAPEPETRLVDLMSVLEASVAAARAARNDEEEAGKPATAANGAAATARRPRAVAGAKSPKALKAEAADEADEAAPPRRAARARKTA